MKKSQVISQLQDFIVEEIYYNPTRWPGLSFADISAAFTWAIYFMGSESEKFEQSRAKAARRKPKRKTRN